MQVKSVGIQHYQQLAGREKASVPSADNNDKTQKTSPDVTIVPQDETSGSRLAVQAPHGSYAEALTEAEKKALDILFSRFKDGGRFGPGYNRASSSDGDSGPLGNFVDVKA
ncbi:MAG: hypothetical protein U9R56_05890 [candidate division Zixibacteria bacterium]|nr:hypothetical protein [candidate division Zixibacteria bacterium]